MTYEYDWLCSPTFVTSLKSFDVFRLTFHVKFFVRTGVNPTVSSYPEFFMLPPFTGIVSIPYS